MQLYNWKETIIQIKFKVSAPASEANCERIFTVFDEIFFTVITEQLH